MRRHLMKATEWELVDATSEFTSKIIIWTTDGSVIYGVSRGGIKSYRLTRASGVTYVEFTYEGSLTENYALLYGKSTQTHAQFISQEHPYADLEKGTRYKFKVAWPEGADVLCVNGTAGMGVKLYKYK